MKLLKNRDTISKSLKSRKCKYSKSVNKTSSGSSWMFIFNLLHRPLVSHVSILIFTQCTPLLSGYQLGPRPVLTWHRRNKHFYRVKKYLIFLWKYRTRCVITFWVLSILFYIKFDKTLFDPPKFFPAVFLVSLICLQWKQPHAAPCLPRSWITNTKIRYGIFCKYFKYYISRFHLMYINIKFISGNKTKVRLLNYSIKWEIEMIISIWYSPFILDRYSLFSSVTLISKLEVTLISKLELT